MLNDLIRKTNILASELKDCQEKGVGVAAAELKYKQIKEQTLKYIKDNAISKDKVVLVEREVMKEIKKSADELKARTAYESARDIAERALKEFEWLQRGYKAGMGMAHVDYIKAKAAMDDFKDRLNRATMRERATMIEQFGDLDKTYRLAKAEYEKLGNTDRAELFNRLKEAQSTYNSAQSECKKAKKAINKLTRKIFVFKKIEAEKGVFEKDILEGISTIGAKDNIAPTPTSSLSDSKEFYNFAEKANEKINQVKIDENDVYEGLSEEDHDELNAQIREAVSNVLTNNERFKFILEEVRFQASMEVAKVCAEVERIKQDAFLEAQKLSEELKKLKDDADFLRGEAEKARLAMSTVNKAKIAATENANKTILAAKKTVYAAKKAIMAANTANMRVNMMNGGSANNNDISEE